MKRKNSEILSKLRNSEQTQKFWAGWSLCTALLHRSYFVLDQESESLVSLGMWWEVCVTELGSSWPLPLSQHIRHNQLNADRWVPENISLCRRFIDLFVQLGILLFVCSVCMFMFCVRLFSPTYKTKQLWCCLWELKLIRVTWGLMLCQVSAQVNHEFYYLQISFTTTSRIFSLLWHIEPSLNPWNMFGKKMKITFLDFLTWVKHLA